MLCLEDKSVVQRASLCGNLPECFLALLHIGRPYFIGTHKCFHSHQEVLESKSSALFLDDLPELQKKAIVSFIIPVRPSVRPSAYNNFAPTRLIFHKIRYFEYFFKTSAVKFQFC